MDLFEGRAGSRRRQIWTEGSGTETGKTGRVLCGLPRANSHLRLFPGPGGVLPASGTAGRSPAAFELLFAVLVSEALARVSRALCALQSAEGDGPGPSGSCGLASWTHRALTSSSQRSSFPGAPESPEMETHGEGRSPLLSASFAQEVA